VRRGDELFLNCQYPDLPIKLPGIDWEQVRACRPGQVSPPRRYARRPRSRAAVIRRWVAELGARYDVEVWAWYDARDDTWEIDWTRNDDGEPTRDQVATALAADPPASRHRGCVELDTPAGSAVRWARRMLEPHGSVILDTVIHAGAAVSTRGRPNAAWWPAAA